MTQRQINEANMISGINTHFAERLAAWNTKPVIVQSVNTLKSTSDALDLKMKTQNDLSSLDLGGQKDYYKNSMCESGIQVVIRVRPYAKRTNNVELLKAIDFSETSIAQGSGAEVAKRCETIASKAAEVLVAAKDFGLTQANIDALKKAIADYDKYTDKKTTTTGNLSTATATIPTLIKAAKEELKILDDLVPALVTDKEFIDTYFQLRVVKHVGEKLNGKTNSQAPMPK